ncbi:uncharacterized protein ACO6RY_11615 [Pungitius sinensis]
MGGDSLCGDLSSEGGAKEEHSSAETHMQTSHCTTEPHLRFTMSVDHNTSRPVHSDQSSDEEEVGAFARPRYTPRRQISATGTTDQILLPDIGAKPADSLVAKACSQKETFPNSFWNNEEAAWNENEAGQELKSCVQRWFPSETRPLPGECVRLQMCRTPCLNRHVRPFSCPRCPMTFSRQYRVTEHMRVHQRFVLRSDFRPASSI